MSEPLLRTDSLTRHFKVGKLFSGDVLHAVDDVDLTIGQGEIVALVGESGSGKSTIARLLARVYKPTRARSTSRGSRSADCAAAASGLPTRATSRWSSRIRTARSTPRTGSRTASCAGSSCTADDLSARQSRGEVERVLGEVGLVPAGAMSGEVPARAERRPAPACRVRPGAALRPKLIIADEPVSMLDVSIRIGLLNLMAELREREGVSFLYITHDVAERAVRRRPRASDVRGPHRRGGADRDGHPRPKHPYTQLLLSAVPDPRAALGISDAADVGEPPKVVNPKEGCRFRARCPFKIERCETETPPLRELDPGRFVACHVAEPDEVTTAPDSPPRPAESP